MLIPVIKCLKVMFLKNIKLKENDFSFCPEITTKIGLQKKLKIKEVPINILVELIKKEKKLLILMDLKQLNHFLNIDFFINLTISIIHKIYI